MRIGKLDARIAIQVNTPTKDAVGDMIASWATQTTVWAQIIPQTGKEAQQGQQELAQDQTEFQIRSGITITPLHRILYAGDYYDIEYIYPIRRGKAIKFRAKRNVA